MVAPSTVKSRIQQTWLEDLFGILYIESGQLEDFTFKTPVGTISLKVPTHAKFVQTDKTVQSYEPSTVSEFNSVLSSETVFYDIGSRYGFFVQVANQIGVPANQIHSFEASRFCYRVLEENVPPGTHTSRIFVGEQTLGEVLAIDDYIKEYQKPDIVKVDVEGAEYCVLQGMTETLEIKMPELYIEVHPHFLKQKTHSPEDIFELLRDHGYDIRMMNHRENKKNWKAINQISPPTEKTYLIHASR